MGSFKAEEEEDCVEDERRCDATQCVHEEVQFGLLEAILLEPFENLVFGHEITAVDGREAATKVNHGRKFVYAILAGVTSVTDLDERDI